MCDPIRHLTVFEIAEREALSAKHPLSNCWNCSRQYPMASESCSACGATNANADYEQACAEMQHGMVQADLGYDRAKTSPVAQAKKLHALTAAEVQARQCFRETI